MERLPDELLASIIGRVGELSACFMVSKRWSRICTSGFECLVVDCERLGQDLVTVEKRVFQVLAQNRDKLTDLDLSIPQGGKSKGKLPSYLPCTLRHVKLGLSHSIKPLPLEEAVLTKLFECEKLESLEIRGFHLPLIPSITKSLFHLKSCFFTNVVMSHEQLETILRLSPNMESLKIVNCKGFKSLKTKSDYQHDHLKACILRNTKMCDEQLERILELCPNLEKLEVSWCQGLATPRVISSKIISLQFEAYSHGKATLEIELSHLQTCRLSGLSISDQQLESILEKNPCLQRLEIWCCNNLDSPTIVTPMMVSTSFEEEYEAEISRRGRKRRRRDGLHGGHQTRRRTKLKL